MATDNTTRYRFLLYQLEASQDQQAFRPFYTYLALNQLPWEKLPASLRTALEPSPINDGDDAPRRLPSSPTAAAARIDDVRFTLVDPSQCGNMIDLCIIVFGILYVT
jgi:hypothetical protein